MKNTLQGCITFKKKKKKRTKQKKNPIQAEEKVSQPEFYRCWQKI